MQFNFTEEQTKQILDSKKNYIASVSKILERSDHHCFDSVCAYLREIHKISDLAESLAQARGGQIWTQIISEGGAWPNTSTVPQELKTQINKYLSDVEVTKLDEKFKNIEPRIAGYIFKSGLEAIEHNMQGFRLLQKGIPALTKTYGVTFSDGSPLTWNPVGGALELAAARSEFNYKMDYLANDKSSMPVIARKP